MKTVYRLPCFWGWLTALGLLLLALVPTYPYVRLIPAGLGLVIAVYCGLTILKRKYPKPAKWLTAGFTALVALLAAVVIVTGVLIIHAGSAQPVPCRYIVVLGAQVDPEGPSVSLQERIDAAYVYLTDHPDAIAVVSGGKGDDECMAEGQCMFLELTAMGIAPERIWVEDQAASTWGNLSYSLDLIEAKTGQRPDSIGVVTHEFHLFRTGLQAEDKGVEVLGIPAKTGDPVRWLHYFIREIAGVWHYIILGGTFE